MVDAQALILFLLLGVSVGVHEVVDPPSNEICETLETCSLQPSPWRAVFSRAGFLGKYALGVSHEFTQRHAVDFLIGLYEIDDDNYYQANVLYRYSRWRVHFAESQWRPLQLGIFALRSLNQDQHFVKSPDTYPYEDYYDGTALRWGLEFATTFEWTKKRWALGYHFRVMDVGLVAVHNNARYDLQYFASSGISLQYLF